MNCPKCGSEMTGIINEGWMAPIGSRPDKWQCPECGYEEKVGEKPDCFYRSGVEIGQCAVCSWLHECCTQKVGGEKR